MSESRRVRILELVAESYIATAHPVPSSKIADELGVSGATVRNEFAALEEEGLLVQPHTSAGRLPTSEGFRRYADAHLPPAPLDASTRARLRAGLDGRHGSELLRALAALASELSGYAVVLELPIDGEVRALEVHLTPLTSQRLLAVAVLDNGLTRNLAIPIDPAPDGAVLDDAERVLRELALPLDAMPDALRERARALGRDLRRTLDALADAWPALHPSERVSHGLTLLLEEPESRDPSFVRRAAQWLERGATPERTVGPLGVAFDEDVALVGSDLALRRCGGRLTLVGPARMRYRRAFSVVDGVGRSLAAPGGSA